MCFIYIANCPTYETLPCGMTSNNGGTQVGATVTYKPASNIMLVGPSIITCQPDGTWSAPMPKCRCKLTLNKQAK